MRCRRTGALAGGRMNTIASLRTRAAKPAVLTPLKATGREEVAVRGLGAVMAAAPTKPAPAATLAATRAAASMVIRLAGR